MSILINKNTRVMTQGITGKTGQFHTKMGKEYANGKNCYVAGVTPKKKSLAKARGVSERRAPAKPVRASFEEVVILISHRDEGRVRGVLSTCPLREPAGTRFPPSSVPGRPGRLARCA